MNVIINTLLFLSVICSSAFADSIKFGLDSSHSPPLLYQFENQNMAIVSGGLMYELSVVIAEALSDDYSINAVASGRLGPELINKDLDLACYNSSKWGTSFSSQVDWSNPLYTSASVLVANKDIPFMRADQIANAKVGTIENYFYHDLEDAFKNKSLQRVDSVSTIANVNKLIENRVEYVVMSDVEFVHYKKNHPSLKRSSFSIDKFNIQCALSKKSTVSLKKLNEVIDRLTKRQVFQNIYKRYLNPKTNLNPVIYGFNDTNSPPFLIYDNAKEYPTITGGVFIDIGLEIGKRLKRPVKLVLSPRKRLDSGLADGRIELVCYNAEAWAGEFAKQYYWSIPIFKHSNYVVSNGKFKGNADLKTIKDLKGKTIGTTLGFIYPNLMPYFKDGSITREDVLSGAANVSKLNAARIPFILLNNLEYNYYKKTNPDLQRAPFEVDPMLVGCAVSKKSDLKIKDINAAISESKKTGQLQKIFSR